MKDLLASDDQPALELAAIKRDLTRVPEMMPLERLLDVFLTSRAHLALVLDEFGGAAGIVTIDDVIEELVGQMKDEFHAEQPAIERTSASAFIVQGSLALHELRELTGLDLESADVTSVGGYVTQWLGHLPTRGETTRIGDFRVTVTECDSRRVRRVEFERIAEPGIA